MQRLTRLSSFFVAAVYVGVFLFVQSAPRAAQAPQAVPPVAARTGAQLYADNCAACHGPDGKGRERSVVGFDVPLPDFSDCSFASREADPDWLAVTHSGGPTRGFSRIMPAFGAALSESEMLAILGHIRTFCGNPAWPRGELNLPRALLTEKAFPEDEAVVTFAAAASGQASFSSTIIYEKRFGPRNQIELKLPVEASRGETDNIWRGGAGDIVVGFKRTVAHSLARGSIFAVAGEMVLPTGDESAGLSKTTPVFETFASFGQVLPANSFIQAQAGVEVPFDSAKAEREAFWRVAAGKTWVQGAFGRSWTPMVELVAARELKGGEPILWDLAPQVQVSLNTRQHLLASVGVRVPLNQRNGRSTQVLFYILWDWFDGGLRDGWK